MEFNVKRNTVYRELVVSLGGATLQSGLLSEQECRDMAGQLRSTADDLVYSFCNPGVGESLSDPALRVKLAQG